MSYKDVLPHNKQTHTDGYTIRLGEKVPDGNVNLAYVGIGEDDTSPIGLDILDAHKYKNEDDFELQAFVGEDYSLRTSQFTNRFYTSDIKITNIYSDDGYPLYYSHTPFDVNDPADNLSTENDNEIITNVEVFRLEGEMPSTHRYRVEIVSDQRIIVYTNFKSRLNETYKVRFSIYSETEGEIVDEKERILKPEKHFEQVEYDDDWPARARSNQFAIKENEDGYYEIFVTEQGIEEPDYARNPEKFRFDIDVNFDHFIEELSKHPTEKDSPLRRSTLHVGIMPMYDNTVPQTTVIFMQGLLGYVPEGIILKNPYPHGMEDDIKDDRGWIDMVHENNQYQSSYWETDIRMPIEHLQEYDLIIICGQGNHTLSNNQREKISKYLESGGKIWIDNHGGYDENKLNIENFPINFDFNYIEEIDEEEDNDFSKRDYMDVMRRYKNLYEQDLIGRHAISVSVDTDELDSYNEMFLYEGNPILIGGSYERRGKIFISSTNFIRYAAQNSSGFEPLFIENFLVRMTEYKWIHIGEYGSAVLDMDSLMNIDYQQNGYSKRDIMLDTIAVREKFYRIFDDTREHAYPTERFDETSIYVRITEGDVMYHPSIYGLGETQSLYFFTEQTAEPWDIDTEGMIINTV